MLPHRRGCSIPRDRLSFGNAGGAGFENQPRIEEMFTVAVADTMPVPTVAVSYM